MKLPSIQFYPGDWRKDPGIQALTYEERGVWFEMLLIMFESSERGFLVLNGQKMPDEALARMLGLLNQEVNQIVSKLIAYGVAKVEDETGIIFCSRMVKDEVLRKTRSKAGKLGGNPNLLKQNPTTGVKQNLTPSSSSSSSSSSSNINRRDNKFSPEDLQLAKRIRTTLVSDNPKFSNGKNLEVWASDIRLMREADKYSHSEIWVLFEFAHSDTFWRPNIRSPCKLREKADTLTTKMNQGKIIHPEKKSPYQKNRERIQQAASNYSPDTTKRLT